MTSSFRARRAKLGGARGVEGDQRERKIAPERLEAARESVMGRLESREVQGGLPVDGGTLAGHTALFDGHEPDEAAAAVWSLIDDGTLTYDPATDEVDRSRGGAR